MLKGILRLPGNLTVRPARPGDRRFQEQLTKDRMEILRFSTAGKDERAHLTDMQHIAQVEGYGAAFPNAVYFIIELMGERVGKLTLDWNGRAARIVDLYFTQKAQGKGYGETVIQALLAACGPANCPLEISCRIDFVAFRGFLVRQGFVGTPPDPGAAYQLFTWMPPTRRAQPAAP
jgi:GNAT superfamily N-acetyltransferase